MQEKKQLFAPVWRHWRHAFRAYRALIVITFASYGVNTFIDTVVKPVLWKDIFDSFSNGQNPLQPFGIIVLISIIAWFAGRVGDLTVVKSQTKIIKYLKDYALQHLLWQSTNFFLNSFTGSIVAKAKRFAATSENVYDEFIFTMYRILILLVGIFVVIFLSLPLVGFLLAIWVLIFGAVAWYLAKLRTPYDLRSADADSHTTGHLSDIIGSIHTIHSYAREEHEYRSFTKTTYDEYLRRLQAWMRDNFQSAIQAILIMILEITVMYIVIQKAMKGEVSIGTVVMIQAYISSVSTYMWQFGKSVTRIRHSLADAYDMATILDVKGKVEDTTIDELPKLASTAITFSNVSFRYPAIARHILEDFSLQLESGKRYGIVGIRGAGKTTLTRLLLRQFEIEEGKGYLAIGGRPVKEFSRRVLREMISYVPQDPQFPFWTVADIIRLGNADATDEMIVEAAKRASCHDFIMEDLEDGYMTRVGERGIKLSGGQRQCLAIAAAILKDAPIFILDEPTSALDAFTESAIQSALREMKGKTMIAIAHRLTTVAQLDEIVVMDKGKVSERGTHTELLSRKGMYAALWKKQVTEQLVLM